jgi:hypothetical protein
MVESQREVDFRRVLTGVNAGLTKFRRAVRQIACSPR